MEESVVDEVVVVVVAEEEESVDESFLDWTVSLMAALLLSDWARIYSRCHLWYYIVSQLQVDVVQSRLILVPFPPGPFSCSLLESWRRVAAPMG